MKIGIIAEGPSDREVITRILKGKLGIDSSDVVSVLPQEHYDETTLASCDPKTFSSWTCVQKECKEQLLISSFLDNPIDEERYLIIQIDTAERGSYDVFAPVRDHTIKDWKDYSGELRSAVIDKMKSWLGGAFPDQLFYAICIEELDAWIIPLYDKSGVVETAQYVNPKKHLQHLLGRLPDKKRKQIATLSSVAAQYREVSDGLQKSKLLAQCMKQNESLRLFCESLDSVKPLTSH